MEGIRGWGEKRGHKGAEGKEAASKSKAPFPRRVGKHVLRTFIRKSWF